MRSSAKMSNVGVHFMLKYVHVCLCLHAVCLYVCVLACMLALCVSWHLYESLMNFPEIDVVLLIPSYKLSGYDSLAQYS